MSSHFSFFFRPKMCPSDTTCSGKRESRHKDLCYLCCPCCHLRGSDDPLTVKDYLRNVARARDIIGEGHRESTPPPCENRRARRPA
jgi:hypothetical protein